MNQNYMPWTNRHIIIISGTDTDFFLQNLITIDIKKILQGQIWPAALLSPQGKILFNFLISRHHNNILIDIAADFSENFIKRLQLYKLHAKFTLELHNTIAIHMLASDSHSMPTNDNLLRDMRFKTKKIYRTYNNLPTEYDHMVIMPQIWWALCAENGIAEMGFDYQTNTIFPHDVNLDCLGAIDFQKGCYVGQEVVSRIKHRTSPRRRLLYVQSKNILPQGLNSILVDNKEIGTMYAQLPHQACAIVRIDKASDAIHNQIPIKVDHVDLQLLQPATSCFDFPISLEKD